MTKDWPPQKITELVSCLDCVLDWSESYFQDFTATLIEIVKEAQEMDTNPSTEPKKDTLEELLKHLSVLYEVNLAETNLKIALTDYQLVLFV